MNEYAQETLLLNKISSGPTGHNKADISLTGLSDILVRFLSMIARNVDTRLERRRW